MSEQQTGLSTDPSKVNQYGANPSDLQEYQNSLEAQIKSLEDRYSNPNWFKVAAGFLKPQLGGFAASLGSASEALGENVEAGRAAALPIAQMRSQLAQSKIMTGQNKDAADLVRAHEAKGAPLSELPDLVSRLTELGSPLAAGPKARLDEARKSQQTAIERAGLIRSSNDQALAKINASLANKEISIADAAKMRSALPAIPEVPDIFAAPAPAKNTDAPLVPDASAKPAGAAAAVTAPAPAAPAAPVVPAEATEAAKPESKKTMIKPAVSMNDEVGDTATTIATRAALAAKYQDQGDQVQNLLRAHGGPESYNDNVAPIENALGLLGYGEKDPVKKAALEAKAKKVMNVLSGDDFQAFLKSVDTGIGGKVGDLYAQISVPIEQFVRARFPEDIQDYAMDLAQNFAQASLARQKLAGINASSARNAELHLSGQASPSLGTSPLAAMKNLLHLHTSFDQFRDMNDFVDQVSAGEHPQYMVDPKNQATRVYDIVHSKGYKDIADKYLNIHRSLEKARNERSQ